MLTEFYGIIMTIVPIIIIGAVFARQIDTRYKNELAFHKAIKGVFFDDKCYQPVKCSSEKLEIKDLYDIRIRKPSKSFNKKGSEDVSDELQDLYGKLEKATKSDPYK